MLWIQRSRILVWLDTTVIFSAKIGACTLIIQASAAKKHLIFPHKCVRSMCSRLMYMPACFLPESVRSSQRGACTISSTAWTSSEATGCVTSTPPVPSRSRTSSPARMVWRSIFIQSNRFNQDRNFWFGTARNWPSAATTLRWDSCLWTAAVSLGVLLHPLKANCK